MRRAFFGLIIFGEAAPTTAWVLLLLLLYRPPASSAAGCYPTFLTSSLGLGCGEYLDVLIAAV